MRIECRMRMVLLTFAVIMPGMHGKCRAEDYTCPVISYEHTGDRELLYVNNPEMIKEEDLADSGNGGKAVFEYALDAGKYRCWAEHSNRTGSRIGCGVILDNNGESPIEVKINCSAPGVYGEEYRDCFNKYGDSIFTLAPGARVWLAEQSEIRDNKFFGYVVDFEVNANCRLYTVAFKEKNDIPDSLTYTGYITRSQGNHREARVYKGWNPHTVATASLKWHLSDTTTEGMLPVYRRTYDPDLEQFEQPYLSTNGWVTNIAIGHESEATMTDMFSFSDPSWNQPFDPYKESDALNMYPNFGNWAVVYHYRTEIVNESESDWEISFWLKGSGLAIAYGDDVGNWHQKRFGGEFEWYRTIVPADSTRIFESRWVLGGPANGNIRQYVRAEKTDDVGQKENEPAGSTYKKSQSLRYPTKTLTNRPFGIEIQDASQRVNPIGKRIPLRLRNNSSPR